MLWRMIGFSVLAAAVAACGSGNKKRQEALANPPAPPPPVAWDSISGVPTGFVDGADDVGLSAVARDATLRGDGAATPLGVDLGAVQARIAAPCPPGSFMAGVSDAGAPDCAAPPAVHAGAGLVDVDGTVSVGFDGSGTSTLAARADHTHPVVLPLFPRMFECGGCARDDNEAGFGGFAFKELQLRSPSSCPAGHSSATIGVPVPVSLAAGPRPFRLRLALVYTGGDSAPAEVRVSWGISADGTVEATCSGTGEPLSIPAAGTRALATVSTRFEPGCGGPGSHLGLKVERTGSAAGTLHLVAADVTFD